MRMRLRGVTPATGRTYIYSPCPGIAASPSSATSRSGHITRCPSRRSRVPRSAYVLFVNFTPFDKVLDVGPFRFGVLTARHDYHQSIAKRSFVKIGLPPGLPSPRPSRAHVRCREWLLHSTKKQPDVRWPHEVCRHPIAPHFSAEQPSRLSNWCYWRG